MTAALTPPPASGRAQEPVLANPWLTIGRVIWAIVVVAAIASYAASASRAGRALLLESSVEDSFAALARFISYPSFARLILASRYFVLTMYLATGLFIFWRRSNTTMGLVASLEVILLPLIAGLGGQPPSYTETVSFAFSGIKPLLDTFLSVALVVTSLLFMGLFPSGRFPSRRLRQATIGMFALLAVLMLLSLAMPTSWSEGISLIGWAGFLVISLVAVTIALGGAVYRYFRLSNATEKQQTRLVLASFAALGLWTAFVAGATPFRSWDSRAAPFALFQIFGGVAVASLVPLSIAWAITRYHLWDIDVVVRRTLVYTLLTGILLAIYLVSIVVLQRLFTAVTGQDSTLATILSTLLIAALFLPLRRQIQNLIDRRFFRRKYDAAKVLEGFATTCRDETDLDKLTAELLRVIQETMEPEHLSLWLREEDGASGGEPKVSFRRHGATPPQSS